MVLEVQIILVRGPGTPLSPVRRSPSVRLKLGADAAAHAPKEGQERDKIHGGHASRERAWTISSL